MNDSEFGSLIRGAASDGAVNRILFGVAIIVVPDDEEMFAGVPEGMVLQDHKFIFVRQSHWDSGIESGLKELMKL